MERVVHLHLFLVCNLHKPESIYYFIQIGFNCNFIISSNHNNTEILEQLSQIQSYSSIFFLILSKSRGNDAHKSSDYLSNNFEIPDYLSDISLILFQRISLIFFQMIFQMYSLTIALATSILSFSQLWL